MRGVPCNNSVRVSEPHAPTEIEHAGPSLGGALAESLSAPLVEACHGQLRELAWFRTDWQRGGAATAKATWEAADGVCTPVVVKLPVNTRELLWMRRLQGGGAHVVPRLFASGDSLASYDLGWLVIEHLPHGPLGARWNDEHIPRIAEAIAEFSLLASRFPVDREARHERWESLLTSAREAVKNNLVADRQQWTAALKTLVARLASIVDPWEARQPLEWLHGDLHLANAMSRVAVDHGAVCLIDLAEVRVGHWIEDAIYLERQLWARPERIKAHKPLKAIADARRARGLSVGDDHQRLATTRRLLLAATAPAFLKSEGAPNYMAACLERLESGLRELK
jgi:hypothetical protein